MTKTKIVKLTVKRDRAGRYLDTDLGRARPITDGSVVVPAGVALIGGPATEAEAGAEVEVMLDPQPYGLLARESDGGGAWAVRS